jgi:hypothetical protein
MEIGRYLATLTPPQEDRVLTCMFEPITSDGRRAAVAAAPGTRCLVMAAENKTDWGGVPDTATALDAGMLYEDACRRFGLRRINAAIRGRIVRNQLRRVLDGQPEPVVASRGE